MIPQGPVPSWPCCCTPWRSRVCGGSPAPRSFPYSGLTTSWASASFCSWRLVSDLGLAPSPRPLSGFRSCGCSRAVLRETLVTCGCRRCLVTQSCLNLCNPTDRSPSGSSVHGICQTRILERVAISFARGSSPPRDQTWVSCIAGRFFTREAPTCAYVTLIN